MATVVHGDLKLEAVNSSTRFEQLSFEFATFLVTFIPHQDQFFSISVKYHRVNCTLNPSGSQVPQKKVERYSMFNFCLREGEPLPPVFKVFSTKPLDEKDLNGLFQPLHSYQVKMV